MRHTGWCPPCMKMTTITLSYKESHFFGLSPVFPVLVPFTTRCASRGSDALAERNLSHRSTRGTMAASPQKCVRKPLEKTQTKAHELRNAAGNSKTKQSV